SRYPKAQHILVPPAAPSPKTPLLVQTIIQPILTHQIHLHPLLLVTFTNLTPTQIKHPLHQPIQQASIQHPNNQHFKNHPIKIHQPHISTLHTFS
uniref:UvrD-helicase domain-containing protein n=1 Tax=Staphylococcus pasteuri TaxID=45972 RepID=UPI0012B7410C